MPLKNIIAILVCLFGCQAVEAKKTVPRIFGNLKDVERYAASLDEYPDPDNNNLENPDFESYLQTLMPSWLVRQMEGNIGFRPSGWSASGFKELLDAVTNERINQGYSGRFIQKKKPNSGDRIIILGELHGAFHSMVRDIRDWINKKWINEKFKILDHNAYVVIDGGVVSRSPYILETLTLILRLMYVNPDRVIYIRGLHEDKEHWEHYGLKKELQIRAAHISREKIPLEKSVNRFFKTLPLALYLIDGKTDKILQVVRISNYGRDVKELDEKNFAQLIAESNCSHCQISGKKRSDMMIDVRAIIRGEQFLKQVNIGKGLVQFSKEEGATSWFILSAPTTTYRSLLGFTYDTYVVLNIFESIDDWTLTLYAQDVTELQGFSRIKVVRLLSGVEVPDEKVREGKVKQLQQQLQETVKEIETIKKDLSNLEGLPKTALSTLGKQLVSKPTVAPKMSSSVVAPQVTAPIAAVSSTTVPAATPATIAVAKPAEMIPSVQKSAEKRPSGQILIGSTMDLSSSLKDTTGWLKSSIEDVFTEFNKSESIKGRKINFVVQDDGYEASRALENVRYFIDVMKAKALLCPFGTPTLEAYSSLIKDGKLMVLFPITGAAHFHSPEFKYIINLRASYVDEGRVLARYALENIKAKKIVIFYQQDIPTIDGALEVFKKANFKDYVLVSYDSKKMGFDDQAKQIINADPEVIILLSIPHSAIGLINAIGTTILNMKLLGWSYLAGEAFQNQAKLKGFSIVVSSVVPNPSQKSQKNLLPLVSEFQLFAKKYNIPLDTLAFEGYIASRLMLAMFAAVQGDITKEHVVAIAENMKDYKGLGGLSLTFNPKTRGLLNKVWLDTGKGDWQEFSTLEEEVSAKQ